MDKERKRIRGTVGHEEGFNSVMSIGLTGKYGKFAWTSYSPIGEPIIGEDGGVERVVAVDWCDMVNKVVAARNDGILDDGEMMGILWFHTSSINDDFVELIYKENNKESENESE